MTTLSEVHAVQTLEALSALYPRPGIGLTQKVVDHFSDHLRWALCFLAMW